MNASQFLPNSDPSRLIPRGSALILLMSALLGAGLAFQNPTPAQAQVAPETATAAAVKTEADSADITRIRKEGLERSEVMKIVSAMTDVIGPRLTNSPGMKRANEWTRDKMTSWGMENARLEAWGPFGRGWSLKKFSLQVVTPQCIPIIAYPKAWSPGLAETLTSAPVVFLDAQTEADLDKYHGKLKGAIVLSGRDRETPAWFEPAGTRLTDSELLALANSAGVGGRRPPPPQPTASPNANANAAPPNRERRAEVGNMTGRLALARRRLSFLMEEGAAALLEPSSQGDGGNLFVASASVPSPPPAAGNAPGRPGAGGGAGMFGFRVSPWQKDAPKTIPQVMVSAEAFNRLVRMIRQGEQLTMAMELDVAFHDEDLMGYNTVADIPGTDPKLKDELVMLGGHLDSWHGGTGATDNAAGCAVAMEAVRILRVLDLKPRRTIRVALWSGEEQGLLGSRAYVNAHFAESGSQRGQFTKKSDHDKLSVYWNLDNGTGKIRGIYLQGNEACRPIFRRWLAPLQDLGAATITGGNTGGTDHVSFDGVGLPGFQFIQDPIEYDTRTHHSTQDVYERLQADDLRQAAVVMAVFTYHAAMMDEKLPRKPAR